MFDPYRKWLGIPEGQRPPTHYQLLGISPDEQDIEVINAAVVRQSAYVRNFQAGKYSAEATRLLNEIAAAKVCLIDPVKRARYDAELSKDAKRVQSYQAPERGGNQADTVRSVSDSSASVTTMPASDSRRLVRRTPTAPLPATRPSIGVPAPPRTMPAQSVTFSLDSPLLRPKRKIAPMWIGVALLACSLPALIVVAVLLVRPHNSRIANNTNQVESSSSGTVLVAAEPAIASKPDNRETPSTGGRTGSPPSPPIVVQSPSVVPNSPSEDEENPFDTPAATSRTRKSGNGAGGNRPEASDMPAGPQDFFDRVGPGIKRPRTSLREANRRNNGFSNPFDKPTVGTDTQFVGSEGGMSKRTVEPESMLYGVDCWPGEWFREKCIGKIEPLFSRDQQRKSRFGAVAREGYAVGAVKIQTINYVNAIQLVFMRVKDNGQLDPDDKYQSDWIGFRGRGKTYTLSGEGKPIIGLHARQGIVVDALALVVDKPTTANDDDE
jgi:hypothetical protein